MILEHCPGWIIDGSRKEWILIVSILLSIAAEELRNFIFFNAFFSTAEINTFN